MVDVTTDIELALTSISPELLKKVYAGITRAGYDVENRSDLGWGYVVVADEAVGDGLNDALSKFLKDLSPFADVIALSSPIIRVARFCTTYTCTTQLSHDNLSQLAKFQAALEISVYPTSDED